MDSDVSSISKIAKKVVNEISKSKEQIMNIIDNIRSEQDSLKTQLVKVRGAIGKIIDDVDELEKQDKRCRRRLVEVSSNFNKYNENDIKEAYETAANIRIKFYTKKNEEDSLRERRDSLEIALRKGLVNIEDGEKVLNQISIVMGFLEGGIISVLEGGEPNAEMFLGIKILEAQENERKRIARDIHDGPAQHMANVVMRVDICKMVIEKNVEEGLKELSELKESVKVALKEVRGIIFDLRPMSLDDLGLIQTIQQTVAISSKESNIDVTLSLKPIDKDVDAIIQVAVYRIIQEVFNNIKKHANAKHVEIKLDFGTKYLMLIITDDGVGFNVEETLKRVNKEGASYGLIGILDRVNQLQGSIEINSKIGVGTTYAVRLPINREVIENAKKGN